MSSNDLRFSASERVYGRAAINQLQAAKVTIVGIGGVGCWVAEALARTALGNIKLIDLDDICLTNTNRQIHALQDNIGLSKVEMTKQRILAINPHCQVTAVADFINQRNQAEHFADQPDVVVDAIDSVAAKVALIAYCKRNKIKVITVGGAGGKTDPLKVTCADLSRTWQDALAAKVRSELRRKHQFSKNPKRRFGIECIYSTEQSVFPAANGEIDYCKSFNQSQSKRLDCAGGLGSAITVTATFGMVAAARVIAKLTRTRDN